MDPVEYVPALKRTSMNGRGSLGNMVSEEPLFRTAAGAGGHVVSGRGRALYDSNYDGDGDDDDAVPAATVRV